MSIRVETSAHIPRGALQPALRLVVVLDALRIPRLLRVLSVEGVNVEIVDARLAIEEMIRCTLAQCDAQHTVSVGFCAFGTPFEEFIEVVSSDFSQSLQITVLNRQVGAGLWSCGSMVSR